MSVITTPAQIAEQVARQVARDGRKDVSGTLFRSALALATLASVLSLGVLLVVMVVDGWSVLTGRLGQFLGSGFSQRSAADAGVFHGILGSLQIALLTAVFAIPVGVGTAVYLVEYSRGGWFARLVELNIRNLAGVPSIVYGLLGLAVFVKTLGAFTQGKTVIAGGMTLAAMVLPLIVIASIEALRAVPQQLREAAYGVGATQWEAVTRQVLPAALPAVLTGIVLALSRALGEAAPLILVGAATGFISFGDASLAESFTGPFTAVPVLIFNFARQPGADWSENAAAASVVILAVVLVVNGLALYLRQRFERRW